MYVYFYDTPAQERAAAKLMLKIEARLAELELRGKIMRMSLLRDHRALVREAISDGAKTIVAVGTDRTFATIASALVASKNDALLAYIPLNDNEPTARILGIPPGVLGVDCLGSRVMTHMDVGMTDRHIFINQIEIAGGGIVLHGHPDWHIALDKNDHDVRIINLGWRIDGRAREIFDPHDGLLTILIDPTGHSGIGGRLFHGARVPTYLPCRAVTITHSGSEPVPVRLDGTITLKTPLTVEVVPKRLRVIVGRERLI